MFFFLQQIFRKDKKMYFLLLFCYLFSICISPFFKYLKMLMVESNFLQYGFEEKDCKEQHP